MTTTHDKNMWVCVYVCMSERNKLVYLASYCKYVLFKIFDSINIFWIWRKQMQMQKNSSHQNAENFSCNKIQNFFMNIQTVFVYMTSVFVMKTKQMFKLVVKFYSMLFGYCSVRFDCFYNQIIRRGDNYGCFPPQTF